MKCLLLLSLAFGICFRDVRSTLTACTTAPDCANEPNADVCTEPNCVCNINYEDVGDTCTLKACSDPATHCGTNTACTSDDKCSCIANFQEVGAACTQITCSADATCTAADANSHCSGSNCACKSNFLGAAVADCTRVSCANDAACTNENSYCEAGGTNNGCTCEFTAPADSTGSCIPTTCSLANAATTCTGSSSCIATTKTYQCLCGVNFSPRKSACVQKECTTNTPSADCDADSACDTNDKCICATNFVASGTRCKRSCTDDGSECGTHSTCTNAVCQCNVNYAGNGVTCAPLTCTGTATTNCHPNSQCSSTSCICATGFVADGTMCRKSCTAATVGTTCSANAICISDKCMCKQNYAGDGNTCTQKSCSAATDCSGTNTACTSDKCECATSYEISSTAVECTLSPTTATTTNTTATTTAPSGNGSEKIVPYNAILAIFGFEIMYFIMNML